MCRKIGYARVSTRDQKLHLQMDALNDAGCDVIFSDHGVSGGKRARVGLDSALDALADGDMLVVYKLCRLARSVKHLTDMMTEFRERGIHFQSLSEGLDTSTPSGRLTFHIFASVAEFQRDLMKPPGHGGRCWAGQRSRTAMGCAKTA